MPRLPRMDAPGVAQHIIQRGNNRQHCFADDEDFASYAHWLDEYANKFRVYIHAWVFMTNHVHLLVTPSEKDAVSKMMQSLGRKYVMFFNKKYKRTGTLWEGRFRSCLVESERYVLECYRYIELNPVRAKIVEYPDEYHWSSYTINATGLKSNLCTPHDSYRSLGSKSVDRQNQYRELIKERIETKLIEDIRRSTQTGLVLGSDLFKMQVRTLLGRRVNHRQRGRPSKNRL